MTRPRRARVHQLAARGRGQPALHGDGRSRVGPRPGAPDVRADPRGRETVRPDVGAADAAGVVQTAQLLGELLAVGARQAPPGAGSAAAGRSRGEQAEKCRPQRNARAAGLALPSSRSAKATSVSPSSRRRPGRLPARPVGRLGGEDGGQSRRPRTVAPDPRPATAAARLTRALVWRAPQAATGASAPSAPGRRNPPQRSPADRSCSSRSLPFSSRSLRQPW